MQKHFKDYLICIGIQVDSTKEWTKKIKEYNDLNILYGDCDRKLYVNSDVSGYQKALSLYFENKDNYIFEENSFVWFGHTKGVTTKRMEYHDWVFPNFWEAKNSIEERLLVDNDKGCFGSHLSYLPSYDTEKIKKIWCNYTNKLLTEEPIKYMYVNTFFVVKNFIFQKVIDKINKSFLYEKLEGVNGFGDRYFFERDFIHFVDMLGYEPLYDSFGVNVSWSVVNPQEYENHLFEWKNKKIKK